MSVETKAAPKFHCPYCGGHQLQVATGTEFSTFTNVTSKKVTTTVFSENTRYWCCQDCGNTFPFPQDLQAQAEALTRSEAFCTKAAIFLAIISLLGIFMFSSVGLGFMAVMSLLVLVEAGVLAFGIAPSKLQKAEKLHAEYENLISKCMEYDAVSDNQ